MFSDECVVFSCNNMNEIKVGSLAVSRYHQIMPLMMFPTILIITSLFLATQPTLLNVIQYWHNYDTILMNKLSLVCQGVTTD